MKMTNVYHLRQDVISDENGDKITVYGIEVPGAENQLPGLFQDIFFDRRKAENFVNLCNECELELKHFKDAVEDAVTEQYMV